MTYARSHFLGYSDRDPDLEGLEQFYVEWRDYNEYMVMQKQSDNLRIKGEVDKETIAVKCSKRGNDVYWWRVWKRIKKLNDLNDQMLFDPHGNVKSSNVLFATSLLMIPNGQLFQKHGKQKPKTSTRGLETCGKSLVISHIFAP